MTISLKLKLSTKVVGMDRDSHKGITNMLKMNIPSKHNIQGGCNKICRNSQQISIKTLKVHCNTHRDPCKQQIS